MFVNIAYLYRRNLARLYFSYPINGWMDAIMMGGWRK
jgi:hypothetical protein